MLRISQIKIPVEADQGELENRIAEIIRIPKEKILGCRIVRRSIEARKHERLSFVYSVDINVKNEASVLRRSRHNNIMLIHEPKYRIPDMGEKELSCRPVVIGSGPAGLFCAYLLAQRGFRPIVLERGEKMEDRKQSVEAFWNGGPLNTESNVQFGEGGAGTFSDGKLNTGITDKQGRLRYILETFVKFGAPQEILYDAKPHIGTDILFDVIRSLRNRIICLGGTFLFRTKAADISVRDGSVKGVVLSDGTVIDTDLCIAAVGHSARDTLRMLQERGVVMQPKAFAAGIRIQHPQTLINESQWGADAPAFLGAAPYKLTAKAADGRGVYTFCMCPGGYVVNASSEEGMLAVNGMSDSGRSSGFANSAVIVSVTPDDYLPYAGQEQPAELSAIAFQRDLERKAFAAGAGSIPVQRFADFKAQRVSVSNGFAPCTKGSWTYADVRQIFPDFMQKDLVSGIADMGDRLKGFDMDDALLMGAESRTSSPVRMLRGETRQGSIAGFYPCGEGAGYAGGIVSAAADGMKTAEEIIHTYRVSGE